MTNAVRSFKYSTEHVILVVLIGLTGLSLAGMFFHPAFFAPAVVCGALSLGLYRIAWGQKVRLAQEIADAGGAHGSVTHTGIVLRTTGVCPAGGRLHRGQEYSVADGRVWPGLCVHAEAAILEAIPQLRQHTEPLWPAPVRYSDADHEFELTLQEVRETAEAA
jgi:hypothetical protein